MTSSIKVKGAIKVDKLKMARITGGDDGDPDDPNTDPDFCGTTAGGDILICTVSYTIAPPDGNEDIVKVKYYRASR